MLQSFEPFVDKKTRILVIGTMPGEASLNAGEYYAYKHNVFWRLASELFNEQRPFDDYAQKLSCLRKQAIGLWDNLRFCERCGSLDSNIKNAVPNNFEKLFKEYPSICRLAFNGQQSYKFFKKFHPQLLDKYQYFVLPSTSPANASISYDKKLELWREAVCL